MPTCFIIEGIRFFFYSNDHEPIHIHVSKDKRGRTETQAKYQVVPHISLIENNNFSNKELSRIEGIIRERQEEIIAKWHTHFDK